MFDIINEFHRIKNVQNSQKMETYGSFLPKSIIYELIRINELYNIGSVIEVD